MWWVVFGCCWVLRERSESRWLSSIISQMFSISCFLPGPGWDCRPGQPALSRTVQAPAGRIFQHFALSHISLPTHPSPPAGRGAVESVLWCPGVAGQAVHCAVSSPAAAVSCCGLQWMILYSWMEGQLAGATHHQSQSVRKWSSFPPVWSWDRLCDNN